jgi:predicted transcriptional regulator
MDYKELAQRFKESGLSQRKFGKQEGISASMVSYYVRKAKTQSSSPMTFTPIKVHDKANQIIKITTPNGITIQIPL